MARRRCRRPEIKVEVGTRVATYDTVLGTNDNTYKIKVGDELEVLELNKVYRTAKVELHGKTDTLSYIYIDMIFKEK